MRYETKSAARTAAVAVKKKLISKGWKIRIWENIGWHFELRKGTIMLYEERRSTKKPYYWTLMGFEKNCVGGQSCFSTDDPKGGFKDPNKAYIAQLIAAKKHLEKIHEVIRMQI